MVLGGVVGDRAEPITQRQKYDYMVLYGHKTRINPMLRKNKLIPATNDWGKKKKKTHSDSQKEVTEYQGEKFL